MTTLANDVPSQHGALLLGDWQRLVHRMAVLRRLWRRQRNRRDYLAHVLSEIGDPKLLEDVGIGPLPDSSVEDWVRTMLYHQQH